METYKILGVNVDNITYHELYEKTLEQIEHGKAPMLIFTPNPEIIHAAAENNQVKEVLNKGDVNLPDGIGILIAARILGYPIKERITGIDALLFLCEKQVGTVFLLGSKPGVAQRAADKLKMSFPGLQVSGVHDGYFKDENSKEIIDIINRSKAEVLFVGLGAPRQERWLIEHRHQLKVKIAMVMGGSLDVISGDKQRAPQFYQSMHLEWLYRLCQEPWRITRIMVIPKFLLSVIKHRI